MSKHRKLFQQSKPKKPFLARLLTWLFSGTFTIVFLVLSTVYLVLYFSLPTLEGEIITQGLSSTVTVERDQMGVPFIKAKNRNDISYTLGWLHAQERFFQMDLLRRKSAGELSELFGSKLVEYDKDARRHRFRQRANDLLATIPKPQKEMLEKYVAGVNHGLNQLTAAPYEYWLLQASPKPWREEDSLLVVFSMYLELQKSSVEREKVMQNAYSTLHHSLYSFLFSDGSSFDAPIDFSVLPLSQIPDIELTRPTIAVNQQNNTYTNHRFDQNIGVDFDALPGSNNFSINGSRSHNGKAIVAGDMHLGHSVPNIWYRASFQYNKTNQQHQIQNSSISLSGVTLPGAPILIAGTNDFIAWTFTNSYGDYSDAIPIELHPERNHLYRTSEDEEWRTMTFHEEEIIVKNESPVRFTLKETDYGPIEIESKPSTESGNKTMAWSYLWIAYSERAINLNLLNLEHTQTVDAAIKIANSTYMPAQNFVVGDTNGNIGWTIIGALPQRMVSSNPVTTIQQHNGQIAWLAQEDYPSVINPTSEAIWTANGRIVGGETFNVIGNGGYALGVRGQQIRDRLLTLSDAEEADLLDIQLDTNARLHWRWKDHLLKTLKEVDFKNAPLRRQFRDIIANWNGKADVDQAGYTLIKYYRNQVKQHLIEHWAKRIDNNANYSFSFYTQQYEYPLWQLVSQKPIAFLPQQFDSYQSLFLKSIDETIESLTKNDRTLAENTWGKHNQLNIQHPISRALPIFDWLLNPAAAPMPGDSNLPRVQGRTFGASQRMVITPGNPEDAIFHMPGGQSGNPLSPFYHKGIKDWINGTVSPLQKQVTQYKLTLSPETE